MPNNQSVLDIKPENQLIEKNKAINIITTTLWSDSLITWSDTIGVWGGFNGEAGNYPDMANAIDIKPENAGITNL